MTDEKPKPKPINSRYQCVSNTTEVFKKFFIEQNYRTLSDMYEEVAEYCGVSPSTISQIRLKGLPPSYILGIKLAEFIGVEPTDIWAIEEVENYEGRPKCIIEGCERVGTSKGLCMKHVYLTRNLNDGRRVDEHRFRD